MKKLFLVNLVILSLFTFSLNSIHAKTSEDYGLTVQNTLPSSPTYVFKRVKEKLSMILKFSNNSKFAYSLQLLEKRLSELVTIVDNKNLDQMVTNSQRFSYQAGITATINAKLKDNQNDKMRKVFNKYSQVLDELRDNYPANSAYWLLMQQNIDTLNILLAEMK